MKISHEEKKVFLENLKNRMIKIESVIGDIDFYDHQRSKFSLKTQRNESSAFSIDKGRTFSSFYTSNTCNLSNANIVSNPSNEIENDNENEKEKEKENGQEIEDNKNIYEELKACLECVSLDGINVSKEEVLKILQKHKHKNSISVHICVMKFILQHISKNFLCDIYNQYNDLYVYIHSNSVIDVYNAFEYKKNIILSHLDFMKNYCNKIKEIMKLKEHINSTRIAETEGFSEKLEKIESQSEMLFSRISTLNASLEETAYKYGTLMHLASRVIMKLKTAKA